MIFDAEYDAESVLVVGHLIVHGERLGRGHRSWGFERAAGQVAPGRGARCLHNYYHALFPARPGLTAGSHCLTDHGLRSGIVEMHCIQ